MTQPQLEHNCYTYVERCGALFGTIDYLHHRLIHHTCDLPVGHVRTHLCVLGTKSVKP